MIRFLFSVLLGCCTATGVQAQSASANDTIYRIRLQNQKVESTRTWANDTVQYRYNQKKYYVKTILPYLKEAVVMFNDLNARLNDPALTGAERRKFIHEQEAVVRSRFEDKIRSLNETQGVLLIKLIARQTGFNLYHQLADFKGTIPAMKWQGWARVHGFNLNRRYHPEEEPDLEQIMAGLGYPLPGSYAGDIDD